VIMRENRSASLRVTVYYFWVFWKKIIFFKFFGQEQPPVFRQTSFRHLSGMHILRLFAWTRKVSEPGISGCGLAVTLRKLNSDWFVHTDSLWIHNRKWFEDQSKNSQWEKQRGH